MTLIASISMGGSKYAVAMVDAATARILAKTDRIEWRRLVEWEKSPLLETLLDAVAGELVGLLEELACRLDDVSRIGIGWPGPGQYSSGMLQATFIPGCRNSQPIHQLLVEAMQRRGLAPYSLRQVRSALDVIVRAAGETMTAEGAFVSRDVTQGVELNVATGIAAAILHRGEPVLSYDSLGETYGQWGRYLFLNQESSRWHWIATPDGSIPEHDEVMVRFTDRCAGPALARRFTFFEGGGTDSEESTTVRDVAKEKRLLQEITFRVIRGEPIASEFAFAAAREIGAAVRCAIEHLGLPPGRVVLAGGVGENFAAPTAGSADVFLSEVHSELPIGFEVVRSRIGLDAELVGFAAPFWQRP